MAGAPCFSRVIFPSFGSQPPSYAPLSPLRPRRDGLPFSVPGFAPRQQARHVRRPYRIHSRCRPTVHLQLLSTPPHGDAVSFGYGPEGTGPGGLAPPGDAPLQAHCPGLQSGGARGAKSSGIGSQSLSPWRSTGSATRAPRAGVLPDASARRARRRARSTPRKSDLVRGAGDPPEAVDEDGRAAADGIDDADHEGIDDRRSSLGLADAKANEVLVPRLTECGEWLRQVEGAAEERGAAREGEGQTWGDVRSVTGSRPPYYVT